MLAVGHDRHENGGKLPRSPLRLGEIAGEIEGHLRDTEIENEDQGRGRNAGTVEVVSRRLISKGEVRAAADHLFLAAQAEIR
jgi:hypothetical protein